MTVVLIVAAAFMFVTMVTNWTLLLTWTRAGLL